MAGRSLAVGQTTPARGNVEANTDQHLQLARMAARYGARVLVFPELSLTGYELDLAPALAFSPDDARLTPLSEGARETGVIMVVGAPVRVGVGLHIGAFILKDDGAIVVHTKQLLGAFVKADVPNGDLPPAEHTIFEPGVLAPLLPLEGHVAGIGVCAEALRRWPVRKAREAGATTYLTSHFATARDIAARHEVMRDHARRHDMAVALASYGGPTAGMEASGRSAIWSQRGDELVQLPARGAAVAVALEDTRGWQAHVISL